MISGSNGERAATRTVQTEVFMERVRVMIADKQIFFRSGLHHALSQEVDLEVLDNDPDQRLIEAVEDESPDVLDPGYRPPPRLKASGLAKELCVVSRIRV